MLSTRASDAFKENNVFGMATPGRTSLKTPAKRVALGARSGSRNVGSSHKGVHRSGHKSALRSGRKHSKGLSSGRRALGDISNTRANLARNGSFTPGVKRGKLKFAPAIAVVTAPKTPKPVAPPEDPFEVECIITGPEVPTPPPEEDFALDMGSVLAHVRARGGPRRRARPVCMTPAKIMPEVVDVDADGASDGSLGIPDMKDLLDDPELAGALNDSIEIHVALGGFSDDDTDM